MNVWLHVMNSQPKQLEAARQYEAGKGRTFYEWLLMLPEMGATSGGDVGVDILPPHIGRCGLCIASICHHMFLSRLRVGTQRLQT